MLKKYFKSIFVLTYMAGSSWRCWQNVYNSKFVLHTGKVNFLQDDSVTICRWQHGTETLDLVLFIICRTYITTHIISVLPKHSKWMFCCFDLEFSSLCVLLSSLIAFFIFRNSVFVREGWWHWTGSITFSLCMVT